jgi:hypothetical protein
VNRDGDTKQVWRPIIVIVRRKRRRPKTRRSLTSLQSRPFGVALLIAGIDEKGPQLCVDATLSKAHPC